MDFADIFKDLDYTTDSLFILLLASFMIQKVNNEREKTVFIFREIRRQMKKA